MGMLKNVWEGQVRLVITYWVWWTLGVFILGFGLLGFFAFFEIDSPVLFTLSFLPYSFFCWVGVWRSATNYDGSEVWAILAKVTVVIGVLIIINDFINPTPLPF